MSKTTVFLNAIKKEGLNGLALALGFLIVGIVYGITSGILSFVDTATASIIVSLVALPLIGIRAEIFSLPNFIIRIGWGAAVLGVVAAFVPAVQPLLAPFTAGFSSVIGFVAILLQLGVAATLGDKMLKAVKL